MGTLQFNRTRIITYTLPVLVVLTSIWIVLSPLFLKYPELATAITYDLTVTAPILFLCLSKKSKISKLKAVPFFIGGIFIASSILPENNQEHLDYIIKYVLPAVELTVFAIIVRKIYGALKTYRTNSLQTTDFHSVSKISSQEVFGKSRYASFFASEITMFYYTFFAWKRRRPKANEFTNYKENASIALAGALVVVVGIETFAFHILLMKWSALAAWILTASSIYTAFMIIGHIKALLYRPIEISQNKLSLKNGLIADCTIALKDIEKIEAYSKELKSDDQKIGNLGLSKESTNHNIAIYFTTPQTIEKMYGFSEECDVLLLHIDDRNRFIDYIKERF